MLDVEQDKRTATFLPQPLPVLASADSRGFKARDAERKRPVRRCPPEASHGGGAERAVRVFADGCSQGHAAAAGLFLALLYLLAGLTA